MRKSAFKKIVVFAVVTLFIGLSTTPSIIAEVAKENTLTKQNSYSDGDSTTYKLLIITPKKFTRFLQPLVKHKNKVDVPTKLVTLNEVYCQMSGQGCDKPEKIKYFIKYAIETWGIEYVLLVGNFRQMPIRYCYNSEPWSGYPEPRFISELYYADIYDKNGGFSSWDTNGNGIYGEWSGDEAQDKDIDLYPDVYVGRLACRTNLEVKIMVNKIITYEKTTYGQEWFKTMVVAAGDTYPPGSYNFSTPTFEGEENTKIALSYMPGFENVTLWTSDGTLTGPKDVINAVNNGCGFLFFDGHGSPMVWSTHLPNDKKNWTKDLTILSMNKFKNKNMYPICVVGGCHNSQFDVALTNLLKNPKDSYYYSTWLPECWSWVMTHKIGGGSIATIGNTGLGMTKEDKSSGEGASDFLDSQLFYEYGTNGTHILGEAWGNAITNYLGKYPIDWSTPAGKDYAIDAKTVQQWTLFGDPSLKIGGYPQ